MTTVQTYTTLQQHIYANQPSGVRGQLSALLNQLGIASVYISSLAGRGVLADAHGLAGNINVQGEEVKRLDELADAAITKYLLNQNLAVALASEEREDILVTGAVPKNGSGYAVLFDPLDGSGNIENNGVVGGIFSVQRVVNNSNLTSADLFQPGKKQAASAFTVFGQRTMFVYTTGSSVHEFTYTPDIGQFVLTHENIRMPNYNPLICVNTRDYPQWLVQIQDYYKRVLGMEQGKRGFNSRNWGSMVGDVYRTLLQGGIFMYPGTINKPNGKLRLLYECGPLALIVNAAGGSAESWSPENGFQSILDITPTALHQRTPIFIGSKGNIEELKTYLNK
ncbi:MAG: class 1 fructose-bisphosphatase [archaeon]